MKNLSDSISGSTEQVLCWILQGLRDGHSEADMLVALLQMGWEDSLSRKMLKAVSDFVKFGDGELFGSGSIPSPDLSNYPAFIGSGDRSVKVLFSIEHPKIVFFADLLSSDECDSLIDAAKPFMNPSRVVDGFDGGDQLDNRRTSSGMFFERGQTPKIKSIESRIASLVNWPVENGEGLQVLRYGEGAEYKPHYDYFDVAGGGCDAIISRGGNRVGTLVIYLNEPPNGGCTFFPDIGLRVYPKKGSAVFFAYSKPCPSTLTLHGGDPVINGEKWIATKWLREKPFC